MKYLFILGVWFVNPVFSQITKSVCFLGNSYTYTNDLPGLISSLASADGNTLIKDQNTPGGYTFQNHSTNSTSLSKIASQNWDYVVLQEQSQLPSFPWSQVTSDVLPFASVLCDSIRSNYACTIPVFFDTWGRQTGDPQWDSIDTFTEMNQRLYNAYEFMANENSALLCPVGIAFEHIANDLAPVVNFNSLYSIDGSHPSIHGSYLAACMFYEELFDMPVSGNTFFPSGVTLAQATYLQDVAHYVLTSEDSIQTSFLQPQAIFTFSVSGSSVTFQNNSLHAFTWEWDFGDGNNSQLESPMHVYSNQGIYNVELIAYYCDRSDTTILTIELTDLNISDENSEISGVIYPNPSRGIIHYPEGAQIEAIHSYEGKLVQPAILGSNTLWLSPGIYFIQIAGEPETKKVIIQY